MPKKRKPDNRGLPERWRLKHGAYYYRVPKGKEPLWDGKKEFRLGKTLPEAYRTWSERVEILGNSRTVGDILDRYALEVVPTKAAASRRRDAQLVSKLRLTLGDQPLTAIRPQHIYQYIEARSRKVTDDTGKTTGGAMTARHEMALLSAAYTKAVQWGYIDKHPFKNEVRLKAPKPRTRYIEDWEIIECLALPPRMHRGGVLAVQAYIRLKLLTGLRGTDLFRLRESSLGDAGINLTISKTGNVRTMEWSDDLRTAVSMAKDARPVDISPFLFCDRYGRGYYNEERGVASGFHAMWQRFMARVIAETKVTERFTEHDLRAKCASDADSLARAQELLAHADSRTTKRIYRRKSEVVKPAH